MKKTFLSLAIFSFCFASAHIPEQLERAIKNSDVVSVKKQLQEASLSANELLSLIDLSQQIIHYRRGADECNQVSIKKTPEQSLFLIGASLSSTVLVYLPLFTLTSILDVHYSKSQLLLCSTANLICAVFCWNGYFKSLRNERKLFKDNFENALAIRQLLLLQTKNS